jgi:dihydrofolate reductase
MRKLVVAAYLTTDGVMQAPGGPQEDRDGGFVHGGWVVPYWDEDLSRLVTQLIQRAGALLLGRRTYEIFSSRWPSVIDDPVAARMQSLPKYVASTTLDNATWPNSTLLKGDIVEEVERLKGEAGGDIWVIGSWSLVQTLVGHDLVDEYHLWTFPILVGRGKRLFEGTIPSCLQLLETRTSRTGVVISSYERIGRRRVARDAVAAEAAAPTPQAVGPEVAAGAPT